MTMMSPAAYCGFMPPQALETISNSAPRARITRTGKGDLLVGVALVGVKTAFHGHYRHPLQLAADQLPGVGDGRERGKWGMSL